MGSQFSLFTHTSVSVLLLNLDSIVQLGDYYIELRFYLNIVLLYNCTTTLLFKYCIIVQWIKAN